MNNRYRIGIVDYQTNKYSLQKPYDKNRYDLHIEDKTIHITQAEREKWNKTVEQIGQMNGTFGGYLRVLEQSIPTKVSELNNDAGYLTEVPSEYLTENELKFKGFVRAGELDDKVNAAVAFISSQYVSKRELYDKHYLTSHQPIKKISDGTNTYELVGDGVVTIKTGPPVIPQYTLPKADEDTLGGVRAGYTLNGRNYPVELDNMNRMFVNVPWVSGGSSGTVNDEWKAWKDQIEAWKSRIDQAIDSIDKNIALNNQDLLRRLEEMKASGDKVKLEVDTINGRIAAITTDLQNTITKTEQNANSWQTITTRFDQFEGTIRQELTAQIKTQVTEAEASITSAVTKNIDGKITGAYIVQKVNAAGSDVIISADHIALNGTTLAQEMIANGITVIDNTNAPVAGLRGHKEAKDNVRIWAGTPTTTNDYTTSAFNVTGTGKLTATNADINGIIYSKNNNTDTEFTLDGANNTFRVRGHSKVLSDGQLDKTSPIENMCMIKFIHDVSNKQVYGGLYLFNPTSGSSSIMSGQNLSITKGNLGLFVDSSHIQFSTSGTSTSILSRNQLILKFNELDVAIELDDNRRCTSFKVKNLPTYENAYTDELCTTTMNGKKVLCIK